MDEHLIFKRYPDLKELILLFRQELLKMQRPADEVVLLDEDIMRMLGICKRNLASMRATRQIPFHQPKPNSRCYYLLSDILHWLKTSRMESINNTIKIK